LLSAINKLKGLILGTSPDVEATDDLPEMSILRGQLEDFRNHILETKKEIGSIGTPGDDEDRLTTAASELVSIVAETEQATHHILNTTKEIGESLDVIKERVDDVEAHAMVDEAMGKAIEIMESYNFQDLSGLRTTRVIKIINYLEERILTMIGIWGAEGFKGIEVEEEVVEGDAALLNGPQDEGQGIDQADIDALFD
jgi:chemotaxis protein CheZ